VFISGSIPYTFPFFLDSISEPFVMLEDQSGFIERNINFQFNLSTQIIGPVEVHSDDTLSYSLSLPAVPQGYFHDLDNDGAEEKGVQVFAIAYWSNTWGGAFVDERDGTGWSGYYASTKTDPERDYEITGGILLLWSPDKDQQFPTGFGDDGLLFTADDPAAPVPAGYSLVDLDQSPFRVYKESQPYLILNEGDLALNDYSELGYVEAWEKFFEKASKEYPFTEEKSIDWNSLRAEFTARIQDVNSSADFYRALRDFTWRIPDGHVSVSQEDFSVFAQEAGGGFGLVLAELSDGKIIAAQVLPGKAAAAVGIQPGAEIVEWDNQPVRQALEAVIPYFGPYSTEQALRQGQLAFLPRAAGLLGNATVRFTNPGSQEPVEKKMRAEFEIDSLLQALPLLNPPRLGLPVEGSFLQDSGLGYLRITTFSDDYNLMAQVWDKYLETAIENEVPGLIIDLRVNPGGNAGLAGDFAGYFTDKTLEFGQSYYYNTISGEFKSTLSADTIEPAPRFYDGPIAVLVSPSCVSACEGFAYMLSLTRNATIIGHASTAGAYGEVGRGQYKFAGGLSLQIPTGRTLDPDGGLIIEGQGVRMDVTVPVTLESALGQVDAVLEAAIQALKDKIGG
jgi:C-terminal processing protease CtpA/Prc